MELKTSQLKANARGHLTGKYAFPMIAYMIADMVISTVTMIASLLGDTQSDAGQLINLGISVILSAIMAIFVVGQNKLSLHIAREVQYPAISDIWYGFKGHADNIIVTYFRIFIREFVYALPFGFAAVLYSIRPEISYMVFLVICGIFSAVMCIRVELDYGMVFFLIIDHPELNSKELLSKSKDLIRGKRKNLLFLYMSFIGMGILVLLTFGFAIFWVAPYVRMTLAEFYIALTTEPLPEEANVESTENIIN
ncbi:MAG: DUF975 family protein [Lachnospiraceae bacterium]|nr:DUF975 family protein [Lachnospiraceae bacterium]